MIYHNIFHLHLDLEEGVGDLAPLQSKFHNLKALYKAFAYTMDHQSFAHTHLQSLTLLISRPLLQTLLAFLGCFHPSTSS